MTAPTPDETVTSVPGPGGASERGSGDAPAAPASTSTSPFTPEYRAVTLGMVALIALSAFESLAVTTTMPAVVDALGGLALYAMAFAAPVASGVIGMVAAGGWTDRRGPGRPLLTGVGLFAVGLVVAGTAAGMEVIVAGRLLQGFGSGLMTVSLYVVVARVFPDAVQPRVFAAFAAAWVIPSIVGPAIAGLITEHLGWRWVFLGVPLLAIPALLALRPAFARVSAPAEPSVSTSADTTGTEIATPEAAARPDWLRLVRAVGAGTGAMALHWGGQQSGVRAGLAIAVGLALLVATVRHLLPVGTLRSARGLPSVILIRGLFGAAFFGAEVYLPLLLISERGLSAAQAGLALTTAAVLWSTGSWLRGRSEGRWDDRTVLRTAALLLMTGIVLASLGAWTSVPVAVGILGWGASGLGMGLGYPTTSLLTLRLSARSEQGTNSSALQVNESLTIAVVLAVSGPLFATLLVRDVTLAYLACFAVAGTLAAAAVLVAGRVKATA